MKILYQQGIIRYSTACGIVLAMLITLSGCFESKDTMDIPDVSTMEPAPVLSLPVRATMIGTQAFAANYTFDPSNTALVEQANVVYDSGFKAFKFGLSERIFSDWETQTGNHSFYDLPERSAYSNLADIAANEPSVRKVLDMTFRVISMWIYEHGENEQFISSSAAYDDMYALTQHLLTEYSGSGKVFLLGHWEGDWGVVGGYDVSMRQLPEGRKTAFINWVNNRQAAIEDARQNTPHENVWVGHYVEVNRVSDYVDDGKERIVNSILPAITVDAISYSAYDAGLNNIARNLDTIESFANTTGYLNPIFPNKKVFVGEFGFALRNNEGVQFRSADEQRDLSMEALQAFQGWGVPLAYYWQLYNNETASDGSEKGFWLIDDQNIKQPVFDAFVEYNESY